MQKINIPENECNNSISIFLNENILSGSNPKNKIKILASISKRGILSFMIKT